MLSKETQKLAEMVKDIKVAMLTTIDEHDELRSRPMITCEIKEDGFVYFFTQSPTPKTNELKNNYRVNISYLDKEDNVYVSISGHANILRDKAKINELWTPVLKAYFPKGKDDESLNVIMVKISHAEYYNFSGNKMETILKTSDVGINR